MGSSTASLSDMGQNSSLSPNCHYPGKHFPVPPIHGCLIQCLPISPSQNQPKVRLLAGYGFFLLWFQGCSGGGGEPRLALNQCDLQGSSDFPHVAGHCSAPQCTHTFTTIRFGHFHYSISRQLCEWLEGLCAKTHPALRWLL